MKKVLCYCLCLTMLLSCLPVNTYAASPALGIDCRSTYSAGETFTVSIVAKNLIDCCGIGFQLDYDAEKLTIVSAAQGDAFAGGQMVENLYYTDDAALFALTGSTPQSIEGTIVEVTFTAKSDSSGETCISVSDSTAVASDSSPILIEGSDQIFSIVPMAEALLTLTPAPGANGNLLLHVDLTKAAYYCVLTFCLQYDSSRYQVVDATRGVAFSGATGVMNMEYAEDAVFISTLFVQPSTQNGRILTVELQPLPGDTPADPFTLDILEYADANYTAMGIDWQFSPVSVTNIACADTVSIDAVVVNLSETQQECTVVLALYTQEGQMLQVSMGTQALPAGTAAEYVLFVPRDDRGAYVTLFSLDGNQHPLSACMTYDFSN